MTDDTHRTAWIATVALAAVVAAGTLLADDMAAVMLFGLLGALSLPLVAGLHTLAGGDE